ncbi:MAG: cysteine hydrolase family protein [Eubacterium sp.]|jgi:nicotinamidase-related amidase
METIWDGCRFDSAHSVLLMIDMEKAFVEPGAALCIAGAKASVPSCMRSVEWARACGIPVIWVKRIYAADGSDMEPPRREALEKAGFRHVLAPDSTGLNSIEEPEGLVRDPQEQVLIKPRYSAFFQTGLHEQLQKAGIDTVLLAGTTTPNCIRSSCYDAMSYNYRTVILEKSCSSRSEAVQRANMEDMEAAGAVICRGEAPLPPVRA